MIDVDSQQRRLAELVAVYPAADELAGRFAAAGHELHLVGGTVRDTLLYGRATGDLDFATSARPAETQRVLDGWVDQIWLTGARFGTVSARKDNVVFEVTTYRSDSYAPGSRHPEVRYGDDITTDLSRRDFTVNAMAVDLLHRRFIDPFGGLGDLQRRLLRTPLSPRTSFADDPLRMVRMARFAAVLDADVDDEALAAATAMAGELSTISRERLRDELDKLVVAPAVGRGLDLLCDAGLAAQFIPEIPALRMQRDPAHHHKDVYAHTIAVLDGCPADDVVLRLAALFHDVGKPATRQFVAGGKVTFHHHEVVGAKLTRKRLTALRYPSKMIDQITQLVALHLRFHGYQDQGWTDSAVRRYARDAGSAEQFRRLNLLTRADVTTQNRRKAHALQAAMDDLERRVDRLRQQEELDALRPPLNGHQIMAHLGLRPGPEVGEAYRFLLDARIERGPLSEAEGYQLLDAWAADRTA
ncbi:MAG TPA: CCA tRNA nucleotidyltransferase [Euzebyales bacterium]|nr:CCA tRNA nucleotidyltransferase [Euzebyales bacterium]